jgi:hypothetical protein
MRNDYHNAQLQQEGTSTNAEAVTDFQQQLGETDKTSPMVFTGNQY